MSAIFDALPGIEVPVGEINRRLDAMWVDTAARGEAAPTADDAKATQVNFVLHLGFQTTPEDAVRQFQTVVRFAQRYPSRIVVLCPLVNETPDRLEMRAKIYGECFLGRSKSDKRCVEFVLLSYPRTARQYLEDQVSICLSVDLPLYYWAHRFSQSGKLADYQYLLRRARRVMIDSATAPEDALTYPWPRPEALRDLALARILPVRQSLGQFLASYPPALLGKGLRQVAVTHSAGLVAEARALSRWLRERLADGCRGEAATFTLSDDADDGPRLAVRFAYDDPAQAFAWQGDLTTRHAKFEASFGGGKTVLPAMVSLLEPEAALSEAMFF
ncbi:glucose-6-phosphate dehydrogenase assembly protein OpcA [Opitutus sp. ER46]|uniref:glucose-6-phosphate dehydrogenase assembly protein OpcA n=1 Tax=Opitutus sp. ER46 TaxID=2161864 RepID=UPI000D31A6C7|nr:glucose-6-phosphate dehydrogenase assembly protein OpcA [Opitutus sp. ER46]PTX91232.1 glucose-6-phosphate dehydrogenase [Opitutus sp. ER46]